MTRNFVTITLFKLLIRVTNVIHNSSCMAATISDLTTTFLTIQRQKVSIQIDSRSILQIWLHQHSAGQERVSGQILISEWMGCAHWFKHFVGSTSRTETTGAVLKKFGHSKIKVLFFFFYKKGAINLLVMYAIYLIIAFKDKIIVSPPQTHQSREIIQFYSYSPGSSWFLSLYVSLMNSFHQKCETLKICLK